MKRLLTTAVLGVVLSSRIVGQSVYLYPQTLQFDTVLANQIDSLSFYVVNHGSAPLSVTDIKTNRPVFTLRDTSFNVPVSDSVQVRVYFRSNQNVTWADVISVENSVTHETLPLKVRATAKYPEQLYAPTQGLWENSLKAALLNLVDNHTSLGYNTARDRMFETVDDPYGIDTIECVYTGRRIYAPTRTEAQNQGFDTEHSWPQSTFSESEPMRSDLNHLFPTDSPANNARSNYPFGIVVSNITWQNGGSKRGLSAGGQVVFEPRDQHKGDVARAMFYFLLRYPVNYGSFMDSTQEWVLRQWCTADPVSQKEALRTNAIALYQGKRNPLVDHPEFIDRMTYFRSSALPPQNPDIAFSPYAISFDTTVVGDSTEWKLLVMNSGTGTLTISGITLQAPSSVFQVGSYVPGVVPDSFQLIPIMFRPQQPDQTSSNFLIIQSNDPDEGTIAIALSGTAAGAATYHYPVSSGWNLVSVPLTVSDYRKSVLFPTSTSSAFAFDQTAGYVARDTLSNRTGYWLKFLSSQSVSMTGTIRTGDTVEVHEGWNLLGSIGSPVPRDSVVQLPPGIVGSGYYGYNGAYAVADTLHPGKGYWVRVNQNGRLLLH